MDWQKNRLWIGALVFSALLAATVWAAIRRGDEGPRGGGPGAGSEARSLPRVARDEVESVEIVRPGEEPIRLRRADGGWRLTAPVDAPADMTSVNSMLDKLSELTVTGIAATHARNHGLLEVTADKGVRVTARKGDTVLCDLWIGATRGGDTMVRPEGKEQVYAVAGSIKYAFNRAVRDWRDRTITDLNPDDVVAVSFVSANGTFRFAKTGQDWGVAPGERPLERFSASKLSGIVQSAARLRATDFGDGVPPETHGLDMPDAATVTLTTGGEAGTQQVVLRIGKAHGEGDREFYARREGDPTVYVLSAYLANRLRPNVDALTNPADAGVAAAPDASSSGTSSGSGGQIPPEVMQQIQQQLRAQGVGGH
jgi:hypothetical protein